MAAVISKTKLSNILSCSSCKTRVTAPVIICTSGHPICRKCKNVLKLNSCSLCQCPFAESTNPVINKILESSTHNCKFSYRGCKAHMPYDQIVKHEKYQCKHRDMTCILEYDSLVRCDEAIEVAKYLDHINDDHWDEIVDIEQDVLYVFRYTLPNKRSIKSNTRTTILRDTSNNVFIELMRYHPSTKNLFVMYHYVGKPATAQKFKFTISLLKNDNQAEVKYKCICAPLNSLSLCSEDKNCLVLNLNFVKRFGKGAIVTYYMKMSKIKK